MPSPRQNYAALSAALFLASSTATAADIPAAEAGTVVQEDLLNQNLVAALEQGYDKLTKPSEKLESIKFFLEDTGLVPERLQAAAYAINNAQDDFFHGTVNELAGFKSRQFAGFLTTTNPNARLKDEVWHALTPEASGDFLRNVFDQRTGSDLYPVSKFSPQAQEILFHLFQKAAEKNPGLLFDHDQMVARLPGGAALLKQQAEKNPFAFLGHADPSVDPWTNKANLPAIDIKKAVPLLHDTENMVNFWNNTDMAEKILPERDFKILSNAAYGQLFALSDAEENIRPVVAAIDALHERKPNQRFAFIQNRSADFLMKALSQQIDTYYPSTYLGIFSVFENKAQAEGKSMAEMMMKMPEPVNGQDSLFLSFLVNTFSYNKLPDLMASVSADHADAFFAKAIHEITGNGNPFDVYNTVNETAILIDVAKAVAQVPDPRIGEAFSRHLVEAYKGAKDPKIEQGIGLAAAYYLEAGKGQGSDTLKAIAATHPKQDMPTLKDDDLFHNRKHVAVFGFYNDAGDKINDGVNSYKGFVADLKKRHWQIKDHGSFIEAIMNGKGNPAEQFIVLANKPDDPEKGYGDLQKYRQQQGLEVQTYGERGHIYNLKVDHIPLGDKPVSVLWGGCGGFGSTLALLARDRNAQIVASNDVGRGATNNALFFAFADQVLKTGSVDWGVVMENARKSGGDTSPYVDPRSNAVGAAARALISPQPKTPAPIPLQSLAGLHHPSFG